MEPVRRNQRYGTVGWEEFIRQKRDLLSAYDSAKEQSRNRPVHAEHGNVGEAKLRQWLAGFLPERYGVTSGFVIPDVREPGYVLYHYDIIIYNAIESPVLWTSTNPDAADQGRTRAIPADFVRAIVEVKATLTRENIRKGKEKLRQLQALGESLKAPFVSCMVFFEVLQPEQKSASIARDFVDEGIPGYFGGLILRAEGLDENVSGQFGFLSRDQTDESMPLVREIGELQCDPSGNPQIKRGDALETFSGEGMWHFDLGYSPIVENVLLRWSYNSFPHFVIELLHRINGTYNPERSSASYGTSYLRIGT